MSDIMRPIPFSQLMNWIIEEHKTQGAVFGAVSYTHLTLPTIA